MTYPYYIKIFDKKYFTLKHAITERKNAKKNNIKFILTNGCFDIIHPGHLNYLKKAKNIGGKLWIGLNTDISIKQIKGNHKPIFKHQNRGYIIKNLKIVDGIFFFNTKRFNLPILKLFPDIYIKAGDYSIKTLNKLEIKALKIINPKIFFIQFTIGFSSSKVLYYIKNILNK